METETRMDAFPRRTTKVVLSTLLGIALQLTWAAGAHAQHTHGAHPGPVSNTVTTALPVASAWPSMLGRPAAAREGELHYGPAVPVGGGLARTYVAVADDGSIELGVALSEEVMEDLPANGDPSGLVMPDGLSTFGYELPLPTLNPTGYRHVMLDWNPGGHEPPGLYDVPHFDFHFYLIDRTTRLGIDPARPDFAERAGRLPDPSLIPARYFLPIPAAVPAMGVHWLDPATPELNGETFSRTMLFGSWDGEVIFAEPMITKDFLMSKPAVTFEIPSASEALPSGPLPQSYTVRWDPDAREYQVGLHLDRPFARDVP